MTAAIAIPLDLRNAGRDPEKRDEMNRQGLGVGNAGEPANTITKEFSHGVAVAFQTTARPEASENLAYALRADSPTGGGQPQAVAYGIDSHATTTSEKDAISHKSGGPRGMGITKEKIGRAHV